jgi:uncharacterized protein YjgD (DUF1641 family)
MRFKDIKEISSSSVRLLTEFGSPGMIRSLQKIKEIASIVQEITDFIQEPQMANNIEYMRTAFEAVQHARDKIRDVSTQINETGIIKDTTNLALSVKSRRDSESEQNLDELIIAFKNMTRSFKSLSDELKRQTI